TSLKPLLQDITPGGTPKRAKQSLNTSRRAKRSPKVDTSDESDEWQPNDTKKSLKRSKPMSNDYRHTKDKPIKCDVNDCQRDQMKAHMNRHRGVRPYRCSHDSCVKEFSTETGLKLHVRVVHQQYTPFACDYDGCDKRFIHKSLLVKHVSSHTKVRKKGGRRRNLDALKCDYIGCGKVSKTPVNARRHRLTHTTDKPLKCAVDGCDYSCVKADQLSTHMNRHNNVRPHQCTGYEGCRKAYFSASLLQRHVCTAHAVDRQYACDYDGCGKRFTSTKSLRAHRDVHTNVLRQFKCPEPGCDRAFKTENSLHYHRYKHSGRTYRCEWPGCEYSSLDMYAVTRHRKRIHECLQWYACEWPGCEYGSKWNESVLRHREVSHGSGVRKYACVWPECGKRFKVKDVLRGHMLTHKGVIHTCDKVKH
ncbi:unnamed protein product, partial [Oppiella nova]